MKRILVFGASGGTGKEVVKQALDYGLMVIVIVRIPELFALVDTNLKVVQGDVLVQSSFENELQGVDVVISCLGTHSKKPTVIYSEGLRNIISAIKKQNLRRLITISAGALDTNDRMSFLVRTLTTLVLQKILKEMYADMRRMETIVAGSDLDWTIVRPPRLTNKSLTGHYRSEVNGHVMRPWSIGRPDLAHYLLSIIKDDKTFKSICEISY